MSNKIPIALKLSRILQLWNLLAEQKDSPTAVVISKRIRKVVPCLRADPSTGLVDDEVVQKASGNGRFGGTKEDTNREYFLPLKPDEHTYLWSKIKLSAAYTNPSFFELEHTAFWAKTLGKAADPDYVDYVKKYPTDPEDDYDAPDPVES